MLVICNGAIKSGSTWLYNILFNLAEFERPPERYLTARSRKRQKNPCIQPKLLEKFLAREDIAHTNYLSKNHIWRPEQRDVLTGNSNVYVFDIERNVRDMVVSAYYDDCNRNGYNGSFDEYYWNSGRYVADEVIRYHATWRSVSERFCMVSYEGLHADFAREVARIGNTLGLELNTETIEHIQQRTNIGALRKRYRDEDLYKENKFFRKGIVGDWKNHFNDVMTKDIAQIEVEGISPIDRRQFVKKFRRAFRRVFSRRG